MKRVKLYILLFCVMITMLLATGCGKSEKVTFVLDWTPNTNHTGVYVAVEKGYYAEEGLDVAIIQPSDMGADAMVASGTAQFGVSYQESVTFARAENVPLVSIAAVIQHNTSGFGALKEKNIKSPKDFVGKKYGGWGSPVEEATIRYLMEKAGADPDKVEILSVGTADFFQASSSGQIDFAWIFEGWDGVAAKLKGIEIDYIDLGKTDPVFDYYTPVIVTSEEMIQNNSKLVEAFMRATIKGYRYAMEHPEEAAEIFIKAVPEADPELIRESQKFLADKYQADAPYWGMQKKEVWQRYNDWLYENGFIAEPIDVEKAFTNRFVE
ncbi:MAG TPA: ABC transporter substrate-binding protein [Thermoclostridium caenicola]|uniref:ABC transporter substrate-binding protein n=1 Tax=Thermoclostridium caenicola TaxID=659425 RepID=UPI002B613901|nr:ABC transporter substrate-binding protein [Thermoclostridium caenicola]HOK44098.1 ABC transporter substrate-binding protein [Thermoclostridium caenicola]HOL85684.1 ABC transporter substrate-binding protein [Thermoclostridium caenicola]HPO77966.1 ABC transporter substrate-binding protein [Thermoclostridium caenicola]